MNDTQLISTQFSPIYFEGGLLIIGRTGTGKTTFLIQSLKELREREDYRVVIFSGIESLVQEKLYLPTDQHVENLTTTELQQWTRSATTWLWLNQSTFPSISHAEIQQQFCCQLSRVIDNWQDPPGAVKTIFVFEQLLEFPTTLLSLTNHSLQDISNFDCVLVTQHLGNSSHPGTEADKLLVKNLRHRLVFSCDPMTSEYLAAGSKMQLRVLSNLPRGQAIMYQRNEIMGRVQIQIR